MKTEDLPEVVLSLKYESGHRSLEFFHDLAGGNLVENHMVMDRNDKGQGCY